MNYLRSDLLIHQELSSELLQTQIVALGKSTEEEKKLKAFADRFFAEKMNWAVKCSISSK